MYSKKKLFKRSAYKLYKNLYHRNVFAEDYNVMTTPCSSCKRCHSFPLTVILERHFRHESSSETNN